MCRATILGTIMAILPRPAASRESQELGLNFISQQNVNSLQHAVYKES